jgi:hypothetical protein
MEDSSDIFATTDIEDDGNSFYLRNGRSGPKTRRWSNVPNEPRLELSAKQWRALTILHQSALLPEDFYVKMWPDGKFIKRDPGSMGGGPSRAQCASNWYLGRLKPLVTRRDYAAPYNGGMWMLTEEGRTAVRRKTQDAQ